MSFNKFSFKQKGIYLRLLFGVFKVKDVNDCDPVFSGSLSGGITEGNSPGTRVFPMTVYIEES